MPIRIRFANTPKCQLGCSIERLADGFLYDFGDGTFKAAPGTLIAPLPEDSGDFAGRYKLTLDPTPVAQFADGHYAVTVHDLARANVVVDELACTMAGGDDSPPWAALGRKVDRAGDVFAELIGQIRDDRSRPRPIGLYAQILPPA